MMLDLWYKTATIYSLNVGAYMDGNGDGVGDFRGLTTRLDYIAELGVNCLWLLPFFPSPQLDYGFDVTDYYNIAPEYGTLGDFVEFSREARLRGLRLLIDLPLNHTSDQHPWFQAARADPASPYRDYYVWSDREPANAAEGVVFPGFQTSVWTRDPVAGAWYFHRFYEHQPDLNITNPAVRDEIERIMGFWLELGVSGFRVDAAPFLIDQFQPDGSIFRNYGILDELRDFLSWRRGDAIMLAEANVSPDEIPHFVGHHGRMHMTFAFLINQYLFLALARRRAEPLRRGLSLAPALPKLGQWAQFLRNHDELDLGRLSPEERAEVHAAFAPEPGMGLYSRGIRRRLAPMLGNDRRRIELANSLMFSMPGSPVIFYGDEIGMGDDLSQPERWAVRTCMQWRDSSCGGFTDAPSETLPHPVIQAGPFGSGAVNAVAQQRDPTSLLAWMRRLCAVRRSCPEIGWGEMSIIGTDDPAVFIHRYRHGGKSIIILHNLGDETCQVELRLDSCEVEELVELFGNRIHEADNKKYHIIELDPYGYRWFRSDPC
ncbi:alpha-amylase family protein [Methylobacterium nonmethylotrophicum]|nr:alpha-amylase family protein [Methylobacterium nonmethylotrophicum]